MQAPQAEIAGSSVFSVALVGPLLKCIARCAAKTATVLVCLQERCPDAFREFRRRVEKDAFARGGGVAREVPREEVGFVDGACVLMVRVQVCVCPWRVYMCACGRCVCMCACR